MSGEQGVRELPRGRAEERSKLALVRVISDLIHKLVPDSSGRKNKLGPSGIVLNFWRRLATWRFDGSSERAGVHNPRATAEFSSRDVLPVRSIK